MYTHFGHFKCCTTLEMLEVKLQATYRSHNSCYLL